MQRVEGDLREDCACLHIFTGILSTSTDLKKPSIIKV